MARDDEITTPETPSDIDDGFFRPPGDDGVDPELATLSQPINWSRPALMLALMGAAIYLGTQLTTEISYFFSNTEPVSIGDVTEYPSRINADDPPEVPHNTFVKVTGLPQQLSMSISCTPPTRYFKLIGAHVYVELPMDDEMSTIACKAEREKALPEVAKLDYFEGTGRALALGKVGSKYDRFRQFYEKNADILFCSSLTEGKREKRVQELRQMVRERHRAEHGAEPDEKTLNALMAKETICYDAYLIQADTEPSDHWHFLLFYIVLGLIVLWNLFTMVRWVRRYLLSND